MGAGGSIHQLSIEANAWFKEYFDTDMYIHDYNELDQNHDGGISYEEIKDWIIKKINSNSNSNNKFNILLCNVDIIRYAHIQSASIQLKYSKNKLNNKKNIYESTVVKQRLLSVNDFKSFLINLYIISILFIHYNNANSNNSGNNYYNFNNITLNKDEFKLAVKTFTNCYSINKNDTNSGSNDSIDDDFSLIDLDNNKEISFVEICAYCCQHVNNYYDSKNNSTIEGNNNSNEDDIDYVNEINKAHTAALDNASKVLINNNSDKVGTPLNPIVLSPEELRIKHTKEMEILDNLFLDNNNTNNAIEEVEISDELLHDLEDDNNNNKTINKLRTINSRNLLAIDTLQAELDKNKKIAKFIEIKNNTEEQLNELLHSNNNNSNNHSNNTE